MTIEYGIVTILYDRKYDTVSRNFCMVKGWMINYIQDYPPIVITIILE